MFEKVLFVRSNGQAVDYDPEQHRGSVTKFLVWEGLLICGGHKFHRFLFDAFKSQNVAPDPQELIGAGNCGEEYDHETAERMYAVVSWASKGFEVTTPTELRSAIAKALDMADYPVR